MKEGNYKYGMDESKEKPCGDGLDLEELVNSSFLKHVCEYACIYGCMYTYVHMCMCVCIYMFVYVYMYVYIYYL